MTVSAVFLRSDSSETGHLVNACSTSLAAVWWLQCSTPSYSLWAVSKSWQSADQITCNHTSNGHGMQEGNTHFRQANTLFEWSHSVATCIGLARTGGSSEARMEECLPGGDYASAKDDPSKSDKPPAIRTTNSAGEQAQGSAQGESKCSQLACCVLSGSMTHIWSRLSLQASSDTAWLSSLCFINPRHVQRRWHITTCLPFPQSWRGRRSPPPPQMRQMEVFA